jgi:hypothetical protein
MTPRPGKLVSRALSAAAIAVLSMLAFVADLAFAQTPAPSPTLGVQEQVQPQGQSQAQPPAPSQAEPAPQPTDKPGLVGEVGKLFEKSLSVLPSLKSTSDTIDDINSRAKDAAKGAGDALSRLAKPGSMVSGRVMCPVAANGTPDCKSAAATLCQSKGFKDGNSLNSDSSEHCSAKVMIPGRQRQAGDCRTDNFVTSALCQ